MYLNSGKGNSNYISYIVIIFAALAAFLMYPRNHPSSPELNPEVVTLPNVIPGGGIGTQQVLFKQCASSLHFNRYIPQGKSPSGEDYRNTVDPRLEIFTVKGEHTILYKKAYEVTGRGNYNIYYPAENGELNNEELSNNGKGKIKVWDSGIIFFLRVDEKGDPVVGTGRNIRGEMVPYYLVDLYQQEGSKPVPGDGPCSSQPKREVSLNPEKSIGNDQLQLNYFLFNSKFDVFSMHCKPAIYLYPPQKMDVNVKVKTKGQLTYTDPPYPDGGWDVIAYPDGSLEILNPKSEIRNYGYLYYESKVPDGLINVPTEGYTVAFASLKDLYKTILPKLGLNEAQIKDFIDYWTKSLPYSPYYFVGIMDQNNINSFEPLEITPKPDEINRVRLYFQALDKKGSNELWEMGNVIEKLTPNPSLLTHNSSQFTVTEWGGMFKQDPLHPFTCSQ